MGQDLKRAAKEGERIAFRIIAAIVGAVGAIVLHRDQHYSQHETRPVWRSTNAWRYGVLAFVVAAVGAMGALISPKVGAVLMALAAIGFIFVAHVPAVFAVVILAVGAIIAFLDRSKISAS